MSDKKGILKFRFFVLWAFFIFFLVTSFIIWFHREFLWRWVEGVWILLQDNESFRFYIVSYGFWAPGIFIFFQIFQVLFSPVPGELVGAAGGYVFGCFPAFIYSSIGLSVGSWLNFFLARLLGKNLIKNIFSSRYLMKIVSFMSRQGMITGLIFFIIPGFPKDYFCYILGLSPINWRSFMVISSIGRIPGTFMLSLQGAAIYNENYWILLFLIFISLVFVLPVYIWRSKIYHWIYLLENKKFFHKKRKNIKFD